MLTVAIDFKSPASYLAFEPTLALARDTGVQIDWLPFSVRPFSVPDEQIGETVGDRHRRVRAMAQRETWLRYAAVQGRDMNFAQVPAGSDAALGAMAAINGDPGPFIAAAFTAYWQKQADLDDHATVASLLSSVGKPVSDASLSSAKLQRARARAVENGIFDAPTYLFGGELFVGREHLPWIRSLIVRAESQ